MLMWEYSRNEYNQRVRSVSFQALFKTLNEIFFVMTSVYVSVSVSFDIIFES